VETMTGGCQCGHVRYAAKVDGNEAYLCHCRMCQRATGGVSIAFKSLAKADVAWELEPDWYASSPIAKRPFCRECGTPLGFAFNASPRMDLTVGSFDDPSAFVPTGHSGAESLHEAWLDTRALPRHRSDDAGSSVVARWHEAGLQVPM
jgi:hypothetical protein